MKSGCENGKKKPQISLLRYAPVEMTNLFYEWMPVTLGEAVNFPNKFVISTGA
jgi:hypothetical protein